MAWGVTKKQTKSEIEKERLLRHDTEKRVYRYIRQTLDRGIQQYNLNRSTTEFEKIMQGEYLLGLCEVLEEYLQAGLAWEFPGRFFTSGAQGSADSVIEITKEEVNEDGHISSFTVREYYNDRSMAKMVDTDEVVHVSDGERLGLVMKIAHHGKSKYEIVELSVIQGI